MNKRETEGEGKKGGEKNPQFQISELYEDFPDGFIACSSLSRPVTDIIKEQSKELRGTQRQITRDRAALERQERQMVSGTKQFHIC